MIDDIDNADDNNDIGDTLNILIKKFSIPTIRILKRIASILFIATILIKSILIHFSFYIITTIIF